MDVGKPTREYVVEPVEDPVPRELPLPEADPDANEPDPAYPPSDERPRSLGSTTVATIRP